MHINPSTRNNTRFCQIPTHHWGASSDGIYSRYSKVSTLQLILLKTVSNRHPASAEVHLDCGVACLSKSRRRVSGTQKALHFSSFVLKVSWFWLSWRPNRSALLSLSAKSTRTWCDVSFSSNAMEKSTSSNQAICIHNINHVEEKGKYIITMGSLQLEGMLPRPRGGTRKALSRTPKPQLQQHPGPQIGGNRSGHGGYIRAFRWLLVLVASLWIAPASAAFLDFQNCLSDDYRQNTPTRLQFVPKFLDARFNSSDPSHNLNVTVWGNVTGSGPNSLVLLPSANDTEYWGSNQTNLGGKILNIPEPDSDDPKITTLSNKVNVLTYEPFNENVAFCERLINGSCPLAPRFDANE